MNDQDKFLSLDDIHEMTLQNLLFSLSENNIKILEDRTTFDSYERKVSEICFENVQPRTLDKILISLEESYVRKSASKMVFYEKKTVVENFKQNVWTIRNDQGCFTALSLETINPFLSEIAISPNVGQNYKHNPLDSKNLSNAVHEVERWFESTLFSNLIASNFEQFYDRQTEEFDDQAYARIEKVVKIFSEKIRQGTIDEIEKNWGEAKHRLDNS